MHNLGFYHMQRILGVGEMAQRLKDLLYKNEDLSLNPRTHVNGEGRQRHHRNCPSHCYKSAVI